MRRRRRPRRDRGAELAGDGDGALEAPYKLHFHSRSPHELESLPYVAFRFESGKVTADETRGFVCPPGLHPSGAMYDFLPGRTPDDIGFSELPAGVYRQLVKRADRATTETQERIEQGGKFQYGQRGEAVFRYACMLQRWYGDDEQAILEGALRFNEQRCEPPIERERVESQVHGSMKKEGGQELPPASVDEPLAQLATSLGEPTLQDVLAAVRSYLEMDATEAVVVAVVLAVAVARDLTDEEPLWLMVVGPPGGGKTEVVSLCKLMADGRIDELTRAGLLSWSTFGRKARGTGLLTRIPPVASSPSQTSRPSSRWATARPGRACSARCASSTTAGCTGRSAANRPATPTSSNGKAG